MPQQTSPAGVPVLFAAARLGWRQRGASLPLSAPARAVRLLPGLLLAASWFVLEGCGGIHEPSSPKELADCYQAEFKIPPPAAVCDLHAKQWVLGGGLGACLRFRADPAAFEELRASFAASDRDAFFAEADEGPDWWQLRQAHLTAFYVHYHWRDDLSQSTAILAYDAEGPPRRVPTTSWPSPSVRRNSSPACAAATIDSAKRARRCRRRENPTTG